MDECLTQRPAPGSKFMCVGDILKMADDLRHREIPIDRLVIVEGVIGWKGELRGLTVKMHHNPKG